MKWFLLLSVLFTSPGFLLCQNYSEKDKIICQTKFKIAANLDLKSKPIGDVLVSIGKSFIGTDYKAYTLESEGKEKLIVNLTELDCTTFIENVLALSCLVKKDSATFENYLKELTFIRYRDGMINTYTSRLHYFSDWISDNIKKNVIKDVTKTLGGVAVNFHLNFMSDHPSLYKHLKENAAFIPVIKSQEDSINTRTYFYMPKDRVSSIEEKLKDGDLIAFTTSIKGLDISHVGIAIKHDGRIHLLHAPQIDTKVQITKFPLSDYIRNLNKDTGIIVLRVLEP